VEEHVGGLDVAVEHALLVQRPEAHETLDEDGPDLGLGDAEVDGLFVVAFGPFFVSLLGADHTVGFDYRVQVSTIAQLHDDTQGQHT
jgi:hypothetical protein